MSSIYTPMHESVVFFRPVTSTFTTKRQWSINFDDYKHQLSLESHCCVFYLTQYGFLTIDLKQVMYPRFKSYSFWFWAWEMACLVSKWLQWQLNRIMAGCPHPNLLWICYLTLPKGLCRWEDYQRWEDYPELLKMGPI